MALTIQVSNDGRGKGDSAFKLEMVFKLGDPGRVIGYVHIDYPIAQLDGVNDSLFQSLHDPVDKVIKYLDMDGVDWITVIEANSELDSYTTSIDIEPHKDQITIRARTGSSVELPLIYSTEKGILSDAFKKLKDEMTKIDNQYQYSGTCSSIDGLKDQYSGTCSSIDGLKDQYYIDYDCRTMNITVRDPISNKYYTTRLATGTSLYYPQDVIRHWIESNEPTLGCMTRIPDSNEYVSVKLKSIEGVIKVKIADLVEGND